MPGEDHRLSEQGPHLGPPDVEHVAAGRQVRQGHAAPPAGQPIAHPGAVQVQRYLVLPAHLVDLPQLRPGIEGAQLSGPGQVHHARKYHVFVVLVPVKALQIGPQLRR